MMVSSKTTATKLGLKKMAVVNGSTVLLASEFSQTMSSRLQMPIQNPVKHLRWSV